MLSAKPVHNRGTAAEQGAAVRRRLEKQQQAAKHYSTPDGTVARNAGTNTTTARQARPETKAHYRKTSPSPPMEFKLARRPSGGKGQRYGDRSKKAFIRDSDGEGAAANRASRMRKTSQKKRRTQAIIAAAASRDEGQVKPAADEDSEGDDDDDDEVRPSRTGSRALRKEDQASEAYAAVAPTRRRRNEQQRNESDEGAALTQNQQVAVGQKARSGAANAAPDLAGSTCKTSKSTRKSRSTDADTKAKPAVEDKGIRASKAGTRSINQEPDASGEKQRVSRFVPLTALTALSGLGVGKVAKGKMPSRDEEPAEPDESPTNRRRNYAKRKRNADATTDNPAFVRSVSTQASSLKHCVDDLEPEYIEDDDGDDDHNYHSTEQADEGRGRNGDTPAVGVRKDGESVVDDGGDSDSSRGDEDDEENLASEGHNGCEAAVALGSIGVVTGAGTTATAAASSDAHDDDQLIRLEKKGRLYPLTGIDNVALLMEDDGYQTACFSVYLFKTDLDYKTVIEFFHKLTDAYPKYRYVCELDPAAAAKKEKAARKGNPPKPTRFDPGRRTRYSKSLKAGGPFRPARWRIDETFRVEDNIRVVRAKQPGDDLSLFDLCGQCLSEHFDFNKPLWEAVLVQGLRTSEGARSGLMIKIHHAFSDGQGMIQSYHSAIEAMQQGVSVSQKQAEIDNKVAQAASKAKGPTEKLYQQKNIGSRNPKPSVVATISHTWHTMRGLYFRHRTTFTYPDSAGKESVGAYGAKLGKNNRPSTRFYAHSQGIAMADIKLIRQAFSTAKVDLSLNDVACAILSRALRIAADAMAEKQNIKKRNRVSDKRVALFIPVSKRPKGDWKLANYTTGTVAWFHFNEPSQYGFEQLLKQVHREMNRIKRSYLPTIWYAIFNKVCKRRAWQLPNYPILRSVFQAIYSEYHVFTNVPGPSKPVSFGNHEAFSYHVLPPSSPGKSTMAMGAISYANDFSLAVSCDGIRRFEEYALSESICEAFQQASVELVGAAKSRLGSKTQ